MSFERALSYSSVSSTAAALGRAPISGRVLAEHNIE